MGQEPEGQVALEMAALQAFATGDQAAREALRDRIGYTGVPQLVSVIGTVAAYTHNLPGAIELTRPLTEHGLDHERPWGHLMIAQLELARGRWAAAEAELATLAQVRTEWAAEFRTAFAAFPLLDLPRTKLEAARDMLARPPRGFAPPPSRCAHTDRAGSTCWGS